MHQEDSGSSTQQEGFGLDADFVAKVASVVTSQLSKLNSLQEIAKLKPLPSQSLSEVVVQPANTVAPVKFDTQVFQNDLNSSFDHKALLHTIPSKYRQSGKSLLEAFDQRANDLTWDAIGTIYIDSVSIPGSDIYQIFPKLFRAHSPKRLKGFQELENKIKSMGLLHLLPHKHERKEAAESKKQIGNAASGSGSTSKAKEEQWWYIGE